MYGRTLPKEAGPIKPQTPHDAGDSPESRLHGRCLIIRKAKYRRC